ncbi:hypothetical protein L7F22_023580 [Adiantum nelumboides]|nr:hypothetical protein [Adiantum nelumboides]
MLAMILRWGVSPHLTSGQVRGACWSSRLLSPPWLSLCAVVQLRRRALRIANCVLGFEGVFQGGTQVCPRDFKGIAGKGELCPGLRRDGGQGKEGGREGMRGAYSTPPPKKFVGRARKGAKQPPAMRATQLRAGPMPAEEVKEVGGELLLVVSQPDVVLEPLPIKTVAVTGERKKKAGKGPNNDDVPPLAVTVVEPEPCKPVAMTKEGKKGALKAQQPDQVKVKGHTGKGQLEKVPEVKIALKRDGVKNKAKKHVEKGQEDEGPADKALALVGFPKRPKLQVKRAKQSGASCTTSTTVTPYVEVINEGKLVGICRAEPPCASRNTLMEKRTRMIQHLKKVHGLDVFIPQRLGGRPRGSVNNDMPKSSVRDQVRAQEQFKDVNQKFAVNRKRIEERAKHRAAHSWDVFLRKAQTAMKKDTFIVVCGQSHENDRSKGTGNEKGDQESPLDQSVGTLIVFSDEDKSRGGSSGGSDDHGDDESNQDGSGDDDPNYGSDGDADDDDGESDKSDGGDDISGGSDGEGDGSGDGGSGSGDDGSGSGGDDISGGDVDEDDGTDDGGGSGKGDSESVSEGGQDVSSDEDE